MKPLYRAIVPVGVEDFAKISSTLPKTVGIVLQIWKGVPEINAYYATLEPNIKKKGLVYGDYLAFFSGNTIRKLGKGKDAVYFLGNTEKALLGEMNFNLENLDSPTVAHEVFHATHWLGRAVGIYNMGWDFTQRQQEQEELLAEFLDTAFTKILLAISKAENKLGLT
jgi:hypothetical protein